MDSTLAGFAYMFESNFRQDRAAAWERQLDLYYQLEDSWFVRGFMAVVLGVSAFGRAVIARRSFLSGAAPRVART